MTNEDTNSSTATASVDPLRLPLSDLLGVVPKRAEEGAPQDHVDMQVVGELDAIADMVKRAEREGLLVEVVAAFGQYRAGGDDVANAAFCALSDWDI